MNDLSTPLRLAALSAWLLILTPACSRAPTDTELTAQAETGAATGRTAEVAYADLALTETRIWAGDPEQPWAQSLAVIGNRIAAVGSAESVASLIGPETEVIDAGVGLVVPGFIDSHVHFLQAGFGLASVQLRDAATPEIFVARIAEHATSLPAGEWITNGDWDHENWGGELPSRHWIDAVTPDNPVMINRLDGHTVLANSTALRLAEVTADTPDVPGGEIVRDAAGEPTGVLKDNAMDLVQRVLPPPTPEQRDRALMAASAYVAAQGVTSVHDMGDWESLATYRRARAAGTLRTRIYAVQPLADHDRLAEEVARNGWGDEWLKIGGLKGFMDGSLGSHTAAFFEPFSDTLGDRGLFVTEPAVIAQRVAAADAAGLQVMVHAIGDRAIATLLDIYQDVAQQNGAGKDRRFRIEHAQHIRPTDIPRFAEQRVIASMQPYHAIDDGRWAERVIGPERSRTTYAFRSLLDSGARVAFGSDWFVAPPLPLTGIYAAVTRRTLDDTHPLGWVPEQKITVEQALVAYTRAAAHAAFDEGSVGMLRQGLLADFVLLDADLTRIAPEKIREVGVLRTVVGGRTVFDAGAAFDASD